VQNDIDGNNESGKICKPGQYFVLTFDFSTIPYSPDLTKANRNLIESLNGSFELFYETYAKYLGEDFTGLCGKINSENISLSLRNCCRLVQRALSRAREQENEQLVGVQGIYVLVDEYDAFANKYLMQPNTVEPCKTSWEGTEVEDTFSSFWSTIKSMGSRGIIRKLFMTGITSLSLFNAGSGLNMVRNLSNHPSLAGLCGLTNSDLKLQPLRHSSDQI
jgi:Predicted AAA-ATPase